ncbi:PLP-dependent transferase [Clavulina sp. PMI_390]|nr:PLP-dependent transferase [Clavulina sp. PMI_390]
MKPLFEVDQRYLNINCGSYGVTPLPVTLAATAFSSHIERNPDWFIRQELESLLLTIRQKLAPLVGCKDVDELVLVPGASHGLGTVFWNLAVAMELGDGDVIVEFSTTYGSIRSTLQFLRDTRPGLIISTLELAFPLSRAALLRKFQAHIRSILSSSCHGFRRPRKVIAIIDTVSSNPGIRFPWEDMVRICRDLGVFSFVDGAHGAGLVPVDLDSADPDTFVSNCHKWMSSKRASAFLYVPKRNHHLMLSTFPVSHNYTTPTPKDPPTRFGSMHNSTGTHDWVPILSIAWGINFRNVIGGEKRIQEYCRTLALEGGRLMARVWHTQVMDDMQLENGDTWTEEGELTTAMVNVLLPLPVASSHARSDDQLQRVLQHLQDAMFAGGFYLPVFLHGPRYIEHSHKKDGRRWWVRASAQVWLELSDFETVAYKMLDICTEVKNNPELFPPH